MAGKVKVELNRKGVIELFQSSEVQGWLESLGSQVADNAGNGYACRVHNASFTAICNVYPDTPEALRDNYKNNSLLKAAGTVSTIGAKPHL